MRPLSRLFNASRAARIPFGRPIGRRFQTVDATATPKSSTFQRIWNSPVGVKTVHFWAPVMKWALVIAGIGDFYRPAEKLSLTQNIALTCTGAIWTRWCLIIKPKNYLLAAVNFFLGCVGTVQVSRIFLYRRSNKESAIAEGVRSAAEEAPGQTGGVVDKPVAVAQNVTK
ncbi:MAG: Mitochondrial pyruvate carrier 2 [Geoglossum umbratile]|nr:MAG: Mitochondrial pyruvate carrier 2 [Geoglossum umbratile]